MKIIPFLKEIDDPRQQGKVIYEMHYVITFSIFALTSKVKGYRDIENYIDGHFKCLKDTYNLTWEKAPSHVTIRDILLSVDADQLEQAFRQASLHELGNTQGITVHIDGKALRGSLQSFEDKPAVQLLSAFCSDKNLILAHEVIEENKTNEIPRAQKMVEELGIQGVTYTFDALHTQKKTAESVVSYGNDMVVQVKKNQKSLYKSCQLRTRVDSIHSSITTHERNRGRTENRTYTVHDGLCSFDENTNLWPYIQQVITVERTVYRDGTYTHERCYYVSTKTEDASYYANVIRDHWKIENANHHVRDVSFREDHSKIRTKPGIIARLRSFSLNLLRQCNPCSSIRELMLKVTINPAPIIALLE